MQRRSYLLAITLVAACGGPAEFEGVCTRPPLEPFALPLEGPEEVSLLLVMDDSASMTEERAAIAEDLIWVVRALSMGDFDGAMRSQARASSSKTARR